MVAPTSSLSVRLAKAPSTVAKRFYGLSGSMFGPILQATGPDFESFYGLLREHVRPIASKMDGNSCDSTVGPRFFGPLRTMKTGAGAILESYWANHW